MSDKITEWWAGQGGDAYHKRCWVDWQKRVPFFRHILTVTGARSVLEFGAGPGWNLFACSAAMDLWEPTLQGVEVNDRAVEIAGSAGLEFGTDVLDADPAELVFTCGCLIHIPPEDISETMEELIDKSYRYVMSIEYEAPEETEIEYRGQKGLLWKRNYTQLYEDKGLTLLETGKLQPDVGFDNTTYSLFTKGARNAD